MEKSQLYVATEPYMKPDQIVAEYQQAKNKSNQIKILAEENALTSTEPIIEILLAYGALTNPPKPKQITWGHNLKTKPANAQKNSLQCTTTAENANIN